MSNAARYALAARAPVLRRMRGLSLVELMIGIAVGMFIVAAASLVTTNQLSDNRRLLLETQVQQDLRAAADLISRDLRRAGFWDQANTGVWSSGNAGVVVNPYQEIGWNANATDRVTYKYKLTSTGAEVDAGLRLSEDGTIDVLLGAGWQPVTDSNTLTVTQFQVTLVQEAINLGGYCLPVCVPSAMTVCPSQRVRRFVVQLQGQAANDANVRRTLNTVVRVPNDAVLGACPP
jgi:type IV pilus assembly protein PilW